MSDYLHGMALRSSLSANLRLVLLALCDAAGEDDGSNCHPSIEYVSYKSGFSVRHCRRILRTLEAAEYIEPVEWIQGGRGHATDYHIYIDRVPMRRPWAEVKAELIVQGRYTETERPIKRDAKGARRQKADILSPISESDVKADILSPINDVKADILSANTSERRTSCPPNIPSSINIPKESEHPYARATRDPSSSINQTERTEPETEAPSLPPPPLAPATAAALWRDARRALQRGMSAHGLSPSEWESWIRPVELATYEADPDSGLRTFTLSAPGSYAAELIETRYRAPVMYALAKAVHLRPDQIALSVVARTGKGA